MLAQSWCILGAKLVNSWRKVGAFLVQSWCILGARLAHSWCKVGAFLAQNRFFHLFAYNFKKKGIKLTRQVKVLNLAFLQKNLCVTVKHFVNPCLGKIAKDRDLGFMFVAPTAPFNCSIKIIYI